MHSPVQISHEELLLLLGLLRLPAPFSLGGQPSLGYSEPGLRLALSCAGASLAARGLLVASGTAGEPARPAPQLAAMLETLARAEGCLIFAGGRPERRELLYLALHGHNPVLHSNPRPRLHRIARLPAPAALIDHVVAAMPPHPRRDGGLIAPAAALEACLDAAGRNDTHGAVHTLRMAGVTASSARQFVAQIGPNPARYALAAMRGLPDSPEALGATIIHGAQATWCAAPVTAGAGELFVRPVGRECLRDHIVALASWAG